MGDQDVHGWITATTIREMIEEMMIKQKKVRTNSRLKTVSKFRDTGRPDLLLKNEDDGQDIEPEDF